MNIPSKPAAIASMPRQCPLCAHAVERILAGHPAYAAPDRFDVYGCGGCDTRFAWPMVASSTIYEQIYRVAARLPGYDRYERLRAAVAASDKPLDLLADKEDVYWGVREALRPLLASGRRPRILEIGSGMGYLTFALHRAGCDIVGIDHSAEAVARATPIRTSPRSENAHSSAARALSRSSICDGEPLMSGAERSVALFRSIRAQ